MSCIVVGQLGMVHASVLRHMCDTPRSAVAVGHVCEAESTWAEHDDARHVISTNTTRMDMIVHCHRLMRVADRSPSPHAPTASSRPSGLHMVQIACGRPMCLQHDSCSWRAMFGMLLTASSHCPAAWKQPTCSRPRPYAPQPLQIEACRTCVAAPRHAPCPAAPRRCTTCFNDA